MAKFNKPINRIKTVVTKYNYAFLFFLYLIMPIWFYVLAALDMPSHEIISATDSLIPFNEWFVIPYVMWFPWIPVVFFWLAYKSKPDFFRGLVLLLSGIVIGLLCHTVYPTNVDLRPETFERSNALVWIVKLIYSADKGTNVLPSLHCYNIYAATFAVFCAKDFRAKWWTNALNIVMSIMVTLSTLFIKQHSTWDAVTAFLLVIVIAPFVYAVDYKKICQRISGTILNFKLRRGA